MDPKNLIWVFTMFNKGLSFIVAQRLWQGLAGLVTVVMITFTLTQEQQGWYYTFLSLAALYSIFEMGLSSALIQVTAHMFVNLHWLTKGRVGGKSVSIFTSFLSRSVKAYFIFASAFLIISFLIGLYVFSHKVSPLITSGIWLLPWFLLVVVTAFNMMTLPFLAVLEGSGEIAEVYAVRLMQGVLGGLGCWLVLLMGGWLWAAIMMPLCSLFVVCFWIVKKRKGLVLYSFKSIHNGEFDWYKELWPLQWRIGINWISVFLMSQLATPILFYYQNPVVAGQMGLSLTIAHMLGILAQSWIVRRVPIMSQAVAKREWNVLDHLFKKDLRHSLVVFFGGVFILLLAHYFISKTYYSERILPFWSFAGLLGFVLFYHINGAFSAQLRSFKREPLVWISLLGGFLILTGSIYEARIHSADGVVMVMLCVETLLVFPMSYFLWRSCNKKWRSLSGEKMNGTFDN